MTDKASKISIFFIFVFLLAPVLHISGQDTSPILRTIVIDPGHGGKDSGCPGPDRKHDEKQIVLNIAKHLGTRIKEEFPSVNVVYTRTGDTYPKLTDRVKIAHRHNADLFISIHCNSNDNKSVSGSSAHILARRDTQNPSRDLFDESVELTKLENSVFEIEEGESGSSGSAEDQILNSLLFHANFDHSVLLAQLVVDNLATKPFRRWGKGIHQNDFLLLKKMTCPAILVECAFLSNANERQLLITDKWQKEIADRLFEAFKSYKMVYDASVTTSDVPEALTEKPAPKAEEDAEAKPAPEKVAVEKKQADEAGSYYSVQIMGLGRLLKNGDPAFKGLKVKAVKADDSAIYKYVCGQHASKTEAAAQLFSIRKKFPEAFVVKVEGDKVTRAK